MKMKYWRKRKHDPAAKWELTTRKEMRAACAPYWADPVNMIQQTRLLWTALDLFALCAEDPNEKPCAGRVCGGLVERYASRQLGFAGAAL
jgi:hypothetical protein